MVQVRQGDLLLIQVSALPQAAERPATRGAHLLALGETTGHAHYVRDLESVMLDANEAMHRFAAEQGVREAGLLIGGLRVTAEQATLWHGTPTTDPAGPRDADHAPIMLPQGDYLVLRPREYDDSAELRIIAD